MWEAWNPWRTLSDSLQWGSIWRCWGSPAFTQYLSNLKLHTDHQRGDIPEMEKLIIQKGKVEINTMRIASHSRVIECLPVSWLARSLTYIQVFKWTSQQKELFYFLLELDIILCLRDNLFAPTQFFKRNKTEQTIQTTVYKVSLYSSLSKKFDLFLTTKWDKNEYLMCFWPFCELHYLEWTEKIF